MHFNILLCQTIMEITLILFKKIVNWHLDSYKITDKFIKYKSSYIPRIFFMIKLNHHCHHLFLNSAGYKY